MKMALSKPCFALIALTCLSCATGGCGSGGTPNQDTTPSRESERPLASSSAVALGELDADLDRLLDGQYRVPHIDGAGIAATLHRLHERPADFLARFEARYFVRAGDAMAPIPADAQSQVLLGMLYAHIPDDVRRVAARHLAIDREALRDRRLIDTEDALVARRDHDLTILADGIDVPMGPGWAAARADRWCVDSVLPAAELIVRVGIDCTCGEPLACTVRLESDRLVIDVKNNPAEPGVCLDCYPTDTACTVPDVSEIQTLEIVFEGSSVGTTQTEDDGVLLPSFPRCPSTP